MCVLNSDFCRSVCVLDFYSVPSAGVSWILTRTRLCCVLDSDSCRSVCVLDFDSISSAGACSILTRTRLYVLDSDVFVFVCVVGAMCRWQA